MKTVSEYCAAFEDWAQKMSEQEETVCGFPNEFSKAWTVVHLAIKKSCMLNRVVYGGERPSQTPCPVHEGRWSGIHCGWPGQKWSDGTPMKECEMLRKWYDAGCRCFMHDACGCTTGWQPDDSCGCGARE